MTDRINKARIQIPVEDARSPGRKVEPEEDDEDVIEIDGDEIDGDIDLDAAAEAVLEEASARVDLPAAPAETPDDAAAPDSNVDVGEVEEFDPEVVPAQEAAKAPAQAAQPEISREAVFEMMQELRQKTEAIDRLSNEKTDLYDKVLRKQAEFENFRKRSEREMQEAYTRARADIVSEFLPVLDNFERALHHADNAGADVIQEGVELIYKQLMDTMARLGLEAIAAHGQPFDPELHEAVAAEPNGDVADHTVMEELQRGYKLGERLLRPARVKVSIQP